MANEPIKILTDKDIGAAISGLIREARGFFTLVSPNTSFVGSWLSDIQIATQRGVDVCVVYNPHLFEVENPTNSKLSELPEGVKTKDVQYLHAKIYMTEKSVMITSMNYTDWSNKNREVAVHFDKQGAPQAYSEVFKYVEGLLGRIPDAAVVEDSLPTKKTQGHCIYCGKNILYHLKRPLCLTHWKPGLSDKPTTKHNYCHSCGEERKTTFNEPRCEECR